VEALTPAQQRVFSDLMSPGELRPRFDPDLSVALRAELERALGPAVEDLGPQPLSIRKTSLAQVHACESHYRSELDRPFAWNVRRARGTVVHRAVELSVGGGGQRHPLDLVDHALASLKVEDPRNSVRDYLLSAPEPELAELRTYANETVAKFRECWPPLKASWTPRAEMRIRAELCDRRISLHGKVDLALGVARGAEARELFVDLKTGWAHPSHLDDLRFYALIQAVRVGVPPFRVASYYLDSASFVAEDVTPETLDIAARRTVEGVGKMIEIRTRKRPAAVNPCPRCRYCRARATCDGARTWEARDQDADSG
jgi:hypothetical protein